MLGLDIAYMYAKFDHFSFSRSGDMVGAHQNLNGSCDLITSFRDSLPSMGLHLLRLTYLPNLKFLSLLTTKVRKAIQIGENKVVWVD